MSGGTREGRGCAARWTRRLAAALCLAACASPTAKPPPGSGALEREGPIAIAVAGLPNIGAGEMAALLARAGVRAANAPCRLLVWPSPHGGDGASRWRPVDEWVGELQAAGFRDLELCIELAETSPSRALLAPSTPVPDSARHAELAAWLAEVVERYDGDGLDDMEGLRAPIRRFRLGSDLGPGGVEPFDAFPALYVRVQAAMRAASPESRLVLPPLRARGRPPGALAWRIERLVAEAMPLDGWSVEASGSADDLDAWLGWLSLRTSGVELEVVGGTTRPLAEGGAPTRCDPDAADRAELDPDTPEAARCALATVFVDLLARSPGAVAWARAEVARDLVQKAVVAAGHRVRRAELATATDSSWWTDPSLEAGAGLAAWSGLLEDERGGAYPAYYALGQLTRWLRDRTSVQRVEVGTPEAHLYALTGPGGTAWLAWFEPAAFTAPGSPLPTLSIAIDAGADRVLLEQVITESQVSEALVDDREVGDGRLHLDLTPTPVFVSPEPDA